MDARVLLVLPGLAFKPDVLLPFAEQVAQRTGATSIQPVEIDVGQGLDSLLECIAERAGEGAILLGWSLGGSLAIAAAAKSPRCAKAVIAMSALPKWIADADWQGIDPQQIAELRKLAEGADRRFMRRFQALVQWPERVSGLAEHMIGAEQASSWLAQLELLSRIDLRDVLPTLSVPVLHLYGDRDAIVPAPAYRQLPALVTRDNSGCASIAGSGHVPFLTHSAETWRHCDRFLASLTA